jgi:hypothetical protein
VNAVFTGLGVKIPDSEFGLDLILKKMKNQIDLVWESLEKNVIKTFYDKLMVSTLWSEKQKMKELHKRFIKDGEYDNVKKFVKIFDKFIKENFIENKDKAKSEVKRINGIFNDYEHKINIYGNKLCHEMKDMINDIKNPTHNKDLKQAETFKKFLTKIKTTKLEICQNMEYIQSKPTNKFIDDTMDQKGIQKMLELISSIKLANAPNDLGDTINTFYSTISRRGGNNFMKSTGRDFKGIGQAFASTEFGAGENLMNRMSIGQGQGNFGQKRGKERESMPVLRIKGDTGLVNGKDVDVNVGGDNVIGNDDGHNDRNKDYDIGSFKGYKRKSSHSHSSLSRGHSRYFKNIKRIF